MKLFITTAVATLAMLLTACSDTIVGNRSPELQLLYGSTTLPYAGGSIALYVTSNYPWTSVTDAPVTLSTGSGGVGSTKVRIECPSNNSSTEAHYTVAFITVTPNNRESRQDITITVEAKK